MPSLSAYNIIRIYSKVEDYEIENKTRIDTEYEREKMMAASTSTSSRYEIPRQMRTWLADIVCCSSSLENDAAYDVLIFSNFLWTANLLNTSTFFVQGQTFFLLFLSAHFIDHELQSG